METPEEINVLVEEYKQKARVLINGLQTRN